MWKLKDTKANMVALTTDMMACRSHFAAKTCTVTKNAIKPIFEDASNLRI